MLKVDNLPSMQSLFVFESAARHLSFTQAAEEFNSTQPAISQKVRQLEEELGIVLFKRVYRGVEFTEEGRFLFSSVQSGFGEIQKGIVELKRRQKKPSINIATDFAVAAFWLMPRISSFRELHPEIDIRVVTSGNLMDMTDVDVAIAFGNGDFPGAESILMFEEEVFPVCSTQYFNDHGSMLKASELLTKPLLDQLVLDKNIWLNWETFFTALDSTIEPPNAVMAFNNYTLLIQAVIAGQGIGLGWGTLVDDLIESEVLVGLKQFSVKTGNGYYILDPAGSAKTQEKQQIIEWLVNLF